MLVGSTPINWKIVTATIGVCLTIFLVGVALVITLSLRCKAKKKNQKPKSEELNIMEQTRIGNCSLTYNP